METTSKLLGSLGENIAFSYLRQRGYQVLLRNFENPLGEIDLIAREGEFLVFIEVKTRSSRWMGEPSEAITHQKRRQLVRVAQSYLKRYALTDIPCRFDVVSILLEPFGIPEIDLIQNAFGECGLC